MVFVGNFQRDLEAEKSREVKLFLSLSPLLIRQRGTILILFCVLSDFAMFRSKSKWTRMLLVALKISRQIC